MGLEGVGQSKPLWVVCFVLLLLFLLGLGSGQLPVFVRLTVVLLLFISVPLPSPAYSHNKFIALLLVREERSSVCLLGQFILHPQNFHQQLLIFYPQFLSFLCLLLHIFLQHRKVLHNCQNGSVGAKILLVYFEPALRTFHRSALHDQLHALLAVRMLPFAHQNRRAGCSIVSQGADETCQVDPFLHLGDDFLCCSCLLLFRQGLALVD